MKRTILASLVTTALLSSANLGAGLGQMFNAQDHEPTGDFENLPIGWYQVVMTESEEKPNANSPGSHILLTYEVTAPQQFAGRKLWERLNLNNQNPKAVEIAQRTLSAICHATNVLQLQDTMQLHGIPMDVKVGLTKPQDGYEQRNEIKSYKALNTGGALVAPAAQTASAAPQQPAQQGGWQQQQPVQQQQQPVQQQPVQQQTQPVQQQQQQWDQQPVAEQQPVQQQQEPAPQAQQVQQQSWENTQPQQQQQAEPVQQQQQAAPVVNEGQGNPSNVATDPQAEAAASAGKAPWEQ